MARDYPLEKVRNFGIIAHIDASFCFQQNSLTPCGFSISTAGKLPFSRPLSRINTGLTFFNKNI